MSGRAPRDRGLDNYAAKVVDALHFCRPATAGFNQLVLITLLRDALRRLLAPDASCPWALAKVRGAAINYGSKSPMPPHLPCLGPLP